MQWPCSTPSPPRRGRGQPRMLCGCGGSVWVRMLPPGAGASRPPGSRLGVVPTRRGAAGRLAAAPGRGLGETAGCRCSLERGCGGSVAAPKRAFAFGFREEFWGGGKLPPSRRSQRHLALGLLETKTRSRQMGVAKCCWGWRCEGKHSECWSRAAFLLVPLAAGRTRAEMAMHPGCRMCRS